MTILLRILLIIASLCTLYMMMKKIRHSKVQIEASIFWVSFALMLVVFSICPPIADFLARLMGIYSTPNFLFLFIIFLLLVKVFYMSIHISELETRVKELVQRMALDEKDNDSDKENI